MPLQESGQEEWEDSVVRSNEARFTEFVSSGQTVKMISWFMIGGILASLAVHQLLTAYDVPAKLLLLLFLGQGLCAVGFRYLKQISWPAKHHVICKSVE